MKREERIQKVKNYLLFIQFDISEALAETINIVEGHQHVPPEMLEKQAEILGTACDEMRKLNRDW